jgi:hypothetical protein
MSKIKGPRVSMLTSEEGSHDVGGTTVIEWARAKRVDPVTGSLVSEKFRKLPSGRIKSGGVRAITTGTAERLTIAVLAAQHVVFVGCDMKGTVCKIGV